jgi:hypothetical protein
MFKLKAPFLLVLIFIVMAGIIGPPCFANSAEPPSILIIVPNAPKDLEISLGNVKAGRRDKAIESYYTFSRYDIKSTDNTLRFTTSNKSFEITVNVSRPSYNNIFTLNLKNQTLSPGKSLSRSITLPSLRVILTLIIEGIVFFLFGYRRKRSWLVFIIVNLVTQGILNIWLAGNYSPLNNYLIFSLIGGEIVVFIVEIIAFLILVKEHGRLRTASFVVLANLLSLIAGGYLITVLPV